MTKIESRMEMVDFELNQNGKLFMDNFGFVCVADPEKYFIGNTVVVRLKGTILGETKIVALRQFLYVQIRDVLSYLECGRPSHWLAESIRRNTNEELIQPNTILYHVVLQYSKRNIETQRKLLQEWWNNKITEQVMQPG